MTHALTTLVVAAIALTGATAPLRAADNWVEVSSPNFRVVSNNGEKSARQLAWQFEQIRAGVTRGWPWAQAPLDRPMLIIGVKDENTMKAFAPAYFEPGKSIRYSSISASAWDRHYILMRADYLVDGTEGVNPYRAAYWTYCDLMLSSAFRYRLPIWFSRGMAAVLSNTNVSEKDAVELKSDNFLAYVRLANLVQRTSGPYTQAARRALLERSVALNGDFAQSQLALSNVLLQMDLFNQALAPARRAVELDPAVFDAHTTLASALARAGRKDEALVAARTAMSLARTDAERRSVQDLVDSIERMK